MFYCLSGMHPATLFELCVVAVRKHHLVARLPPGLIDRHFAACCTGLDLQSAYRLGHAECVEKCVAAGRADASDVARACARWSDFATARATQHLFPNDCLVRWGSRQYLRLVRQDRFFALIDLGIEDFEWRARYIELSERASKIGYVERSDCAPLTSA